ncbi:S-layer homology domain-containing protein [Ruminiclostridium papyrosolvens DSM 2782]|nr:S-layer homology domain-containing protein [Ruminiclostridium papyrosolvens]WES36497.1 S-layer homology domain-containing protein [Ruminiclostridium papyrosolvens DSM 2782]
MKNNIFKDNYYYLCKKLVICFSVLSIMLTMMTLSNNNSSAASILLNDIQNHWAEKDIEKAVDSGYVKGYTDSTFKPDMPVTRAECVSMLNSAFGVTTKESTAHFTDVSTKDWFAANVWTAANASYMSGYPDNTFRPYNFITREQCAMAIFNLTKINANSKKVFQDDGQIANWSRNAVTALASAGIISGYNDGKFYPAKNVTRAQAVVMINNAKSYLSKMSENTSPPQKDSENIEITPVRSSIVVTGSIVNIRANPGTSYSVIGQVKSGDILEANGLSNNWYRVLFNGSTGWITAQYVKETSETSRGGYGRDNQNNSSQTDNNNEQNMQNVTNYVLIWKLSQSESGNIDALIEKAKTLRIGYVIKTHDGSAWWQEQADAIKKFKAAGIPCGAWGYCYGNHLQDEINNVQKSFEAGASFYIADVEKEYENVNMRDKAQQFMSAISQLGPVDYTSYAYPTYHSALPFDIFNQYARYAMPQSYWKLIGDSPQECYDRSVKEYKATGAKNIALMGMICDNVAVSEIKEFQKLCLNNNSPIFWWDYQEASPEMLNAIGIDSF